MKLNKLLALVLSIAMLFTFAACSSAGTAASASPSAGTPSTGETVKVDALTIKFSSTFNENETGGEVLKYFQQQLSDLSGGAITANISWGGTLFTSADELDAVMDGAVNMIALGHMPHLDTLPSLSFPSFAPDSAQNAIDYFEEIMFNNADSSKIIQSEAEKLGVKYLNVIAGGSNAFCAKYAFTDLSTLVSGSSSFGNFDAAPFEALGFKVTAITPPETYDSLQRGLIDATQMALAPMTSLSWYEVAPYWALDNTYSAGNFFTVNLDWWNGLTDAQREVIEKASDATETYSVNMFTDSDDTNITKIEEKTGNKFVAFSDEDCAKWWGILFEAKAKDALARAETNNMTDDMVKILQVAASFTKYDWKYTK